MKELSEYFDTSLYERKKNILKMFHTNFLGQFDFNFSSLWPKRAIFDKISQKAAEKNRYLDQCAMRNKYSYNFIKIPTIYYNNRNNTIE